MGIGLAIVYDPTGATSARIADLHVRITKSEVELIRVVSFLDELERQSTRHGAIAETLLNFDPIWETLTSRERSRLIRLLISRVEFKAKDTSISVSFYPGSIRTLIHEKALRQFSVQLDWYFQKKLLDNVRPKACEGRDRKVMWVGEADPKASGPDACFVSRLIA